MTPYYRLPANNAELLAAGLVWRDTPFAHRGSVPGSMGGVDCVMLCQALQVATGWMRPVAPERIPAYELDESMHTGESKLREALEVFGLLDRGERVERLEDVQSGDVLCFKVGRTFYHLGQVIGPKHFLHVMRGGKVRFEQLAHPVVPEWFIEAWRPLDI